MFAAYNYDLSFPGSTVSIGAADKSSAVNSPDINCLLLAEMKNLSSKMNLMEKGFATTQKQLQSASTSNRQEETDKGKKVKQRVSAASPLQSSEDNYSDSEFLMPAKNSFKKITRFRSKSVSGWRS